MVHNFRWEALNGDFLCLQGDLIPGFEGRKPSLEGGHCGVNGPALGGGLASQVGPEHSVRLAFLPAGSLTSHSILGK